MKHISIINNNFAQQRTTININIPHTREGQGRRKGQGKGNTSFSGQPQPCCPPKSWKRVSKHVNPTHPFVISTARSIQK